MKLLPFLTVMLMLTAVASCAPNRPTPPDADEITAMLTKELSLSSAQAAAVKAVVKESITARDASMKEREGEPPSREAMEKAEKAEKEKLAAILTADQMKKYEQLRKRAHDAPPPPER